MEFDYSSDFGATAHCKKDRLLASKIWLPVFPDILDRMCRYHKAQ
jgi:hypothetical protein